MNKKKNNKGFSLVELIVVIAVMAVLVVVLAPTYLRYVEKSKVNRDVSAVSEVVQAFKVAGATYNIDGLEITIDDSGAIEVKASTNSQNTNASSVQEEIVATVGSNVALKCADLTAEDVTITIASSNGVISVTTTATDDTDDANDAATLIKALK